MVCPVMLVSPYFPTGHGVFADGFGQKCAAGHVEQAILSSSAAAPSTKNFPVGQETVRLVHELAEFAPIDSEYKPATQGVHEVASGFSLP